MQQKYCCITSVCGTSIESVKNLGLLECSTAGINEIYDETRRINYEIVNY
jgi:hypothetical protein